MLSEAEWRSSFDDRFIVNGDLAALVVEARNGEGLSEAEEFRLMRIAQDMFSSAETSYTLSGNTLDGTVGAGIQGMFQGTSMLPPEIGHKAWDESSSIRDPDFVGSVESDCL